MLLALAGLLLVTAGAVLSRRGKISARETVIDTGDCKLPVTILEPTAVTPAGFAVVLHGLSANRRTMDAFGTEFAAAGFRVFSPDLPGHGDNSQSFSFPRAESCASSLLNYLKDHSEILPSRTIVAGHSMGGAIAIRLADRFAAAGTIAISPAPMSPMPTIPPQFLLYAMPHTLPDNLLVLRGGLEPSATADADRALVKLAQGIARQYRPELDSLSEGRNLPRAKWALIPFASHVEMLWDRRVSQQSLEWARESLQSHSVPAARLRTKEDWQTSPRALRLPAIGGALGVFGILCLFPAAATLIAKIAKLSLVPQEWRWLHPLRILAHVGIASAVSVGILNFWIPLKWLRMATGDYLGSFFLLIGLYLLFVFRGLVRKQSLGKLPAWLAGAALSLGIVLGLGAWLNWRLDNAVMNAARWARFVPLALACFPWCLAEELMLGPPDPRRRVSRFLICHASRLLAWVILVLAFFVLHSGQLLIVLLAIFLALFSICHRLGMDGLRRRTGSSGAAALFGAILWAWFLAAALPLT